MTARDRSDRKERGAWYTPVDLVEMVADAAVASWAVVDAAARAGATAGRALRVVDPACGDGRFLVAVASRLRSAGCAVQAVGVDIDPDAVLAARAALASIPPLAAGHAEIDAEVVQADALRFDWSRMEPFDLVVGNPPFLSQMASATTRGGSSGRGGGPYADAAVEFLALAGEIVDADVGRVAFVLPQSLLSARDARPIRVSIDERASLRWSWWTGERVFDANVLTCALVFQFGRHPDASNPRTAGQGSVRTVEEGSVRTVEEGSVRTVEEGSVRTVEEGSVRTVGEWSHVVTRRSGVPELPTTLSTDGVLGDRCRLNANFRDEYYGMIPAVGDHESGPRLITSGLIDPGRCLWGERHVTFAKRRFDRPRLDLSALEGRMTTWAADRLVPKVLIANQTRILEAVADPDGAMLPGVPVVAAYPTGSDAAASAWEIAAVLTSPIASAWAWHRSAGTGLSADAIRVGPVVLADLPWPSGDLSTATAALRDGDVRRCAAGVHATFDCDSDAELFAWWDAALTRIEGRQPTEVTPSTRPD